MPLVDFFGVELVGWVGWDLFSYSSSSSQVG